MGNSPKIPVNFEYKAGFGMSSTTIDKEIGWEHGRSQ